jgi:hypothetical protein
VDQTLALLLIHQMTLKNRPCPVLLWFSQLDDEYYKPLKIVIMIK